LQRQKRDWEGGGAVEGGEEGEVTAAVRRTVGYVARAGTRREKGIILGTRMGSYRGHMAV